MASQNRYTLPFILIILLIGCQKNNLDKGPIYPRNIVTEAGCAVLESGWTVNSAGLVLAEESINSIPTLYQPRYNTFEDFSNHWPLDELAIGYEHNGQVYLYPHRILDKHEIVRFDENYWITLCPLAGTAIGIESLNKLHVSGYLFNSNLMIGLEDGSIFSQMLAIGMFGDQSCQRLPTNSLIEASKLFWESTFPQAKILSSQTGFGKNYDQPPFSATVQLNADLFFPVNFADQSRPNYSFLHGVVHDEHKVKVYPEELFVDGPKLIYDFVDKPVIVIGDLNHKFFTSYYLDDTDGETWEFDLYKSDQEILLKDRQSKSTWNIWGQAIEGSAKGAQLVPTKNHNGFWYAFVAMYQSNLDLYLEDDDE